MHLAFKEQRSDDENRQILSWAHSQFFGGARQDGSHEYRADAPNMGLPSNSLRYISSQIIRDKNPAYRWATQFIPISPEQAAGAKSILYNRVTYTSEWTAEDKGYGTNIGVSDFTLSNIEYRSQRFNTSFSYTNAEITDLEFARRNNNVPAAISIVGEKTKAAMRGWIQLKNQIFSRGLPSKGLIGMLNHPDILRTRIASSLGKGSNAIDNLATLTLMERTISDQSNSEEFADTLLLPDTTLHDLNQQVFDSTSTKSVLSQFMENSFTVENVDRSPELKGAGADGYNLAVMYNRDPETVQAVVPQEITFNPPAYTGQGYRVFVEGEVSGVHLKYPFSALILEYPNNN